MLEAFEWNTLADDNAVGKLFSKFVFLFLFLMRHLLLDFFVFNIWKKVPPNEWCFWYKKFMVVFVLFYIKTHVD